MLPNQSTHVRCLIIPIAAGKRQLLIPSAVVAEITNYKLPEKKIANCPKWLLGMVEWRGQNVPVVSMEDILIQPLTTSSNDHRLVILYGLETSQFLPFYAFIASNIPSAVSLNHKFLTEFTEEKQAGLVFDVTIATKTGAEIASILDVTYVESLLRKVPELFSRSMTG
jgi:chemosensory pili system protein ChpC